MKSELFNTSPTDYPGDATPGRLRGNLADIAPSQVLNLLHFARKTGTLHFYQRQVKRSRFGGGNKDAQAVPGDACGAIVFSDGEVIRASATADDAHLADILYKAHKLDAQQVHLVHNWGSELSEKALALTLINGNYVSQGEVVSGLVQHTLDSVYEIMTWKDVFFAFEEGELPSPDYYLTVPVNTRQLIREGALRTQEIRRLEQELPNLDFSLQLPAQADVNYRGVELNVTEWRVVSYVSPDLTVGQIAALCHLSDSEIRTIVHRLLEAGLVERANSTSRRRRTPLPIPAVRRRSSPDLTSARDENNWH